MKSALLIAVPLGVIVTAFLWWLGEKLSPDAVALVLGLTFGVLAGVPSMALIALARRRDDEDDYIDARPTYADQVTPYTHMLRRATGMPQLPDRQAEIETLRTALHYLEHETQR